MKLLARLIFFTLALLFVAWVIPGIKIDGFFAAMFTVVIIGLVNAVIRPIIMILTLPINILTLGLFTLIINAVMFMFVAWLAPGFQVAGFFSALLGSFLFSIMSIFVNFATN